MLKSLKYLLNYEEHLKVFLHTNHFIIWKLRRYLGYDIQIAHFLRNDFSIFSSEPFCWSRREWDKVRQWRGNGRKPFPAWLHADVFRAPFSALYPSFLFHGNIFLNFCHGGEFGGQLYSRSHKNDRSVRK